MLLRLRSTIKGRSGTIGTHRWPKGRMRLGAERETSVGKLSLSSARERACVCVWRLGCSPWGAQAKFRFLKKKISVLVFAQRAKFHLNSARCFQNQINLHWKPSTGVVRVSRGQEGATIPERPERPAGQGEKLAKMIDSLNENLMENSFELFVSVCFQFLWGPSWRPWRPTRVTGCSPPAALPGHLHRFSSL